MDFFAGTRIMFTAELSVSDLFPKTVHGGHAIERIRRCCKLFLASHFSILSEQKFLGKVSLTKTCQESPLLNRHCFCFVGINKRVIIHLAWPWPTLGMDILLVWRLHAGTRVSLWSVQARRLKSAATRALGVLGEMNHRGWSAHSIALACPHRSLEGLLFATKKTCLRKS